jgi:hypothetical protein
MQRHSSQEDSNSTEETKSPSVEEDTKLKKPESKPSHAMENERTDISST